MVTLNENCSAVIQQNLPTKIKNPGTFVIPCKVGCKEETALCDSGAGISLMPLSLFEKLGIETLKPTPMTLQFADRTIKRPIGIAENVIVQLKNKYVPCDFVIFDMKTDDHASLILGRLFLETARGRLDFANYKLKFHINGEEIEYDCSKTHKYEDDEGDRIVIDSIDVTPDDCLEETKEDLMNCHLEENFDDLGEPPDIENSHDIFDDNQEFVEEFARLVDNLNRRKTEVLDKLHLPEPDPEPDKRDNNPNCSCLDTS